MIQKLEPRHFGPDSGFGGATFSDVIDKVNEIIDAMNGEHDPADIYSEDGRLIAKYNESEDERMIRKIESFLSAYGADYFSNDEWREIENWLEKQKEPKPLTPEEKIKHPLYIEGFEAGKEVGAQCEKVFKEQKPELVQHPPITFTFNSNASRDERLKAALLALLNSDLLKVKEGGYFTKQDLIEWVERIPTDKPAWSEEDNEMYINVASSLRGYSCGLENEEHKRHIKRELDWLENRFKSLRPQPREEIYQSAKHDLAIKFMNYLDENRPEGKMSLSNGECEDIDKAFKENDWAKIMRYVEKYSPQLKQDWSEEDEKMLNDIIGTIAYAWGETSDRVSWLKSLRPSWKLSEDEKRLINTSISFLKDFADKGYENAVECIDWLKSKLNGNLGK